MHNPKIIFWLECFCFSATLVLSVAASAQTQGREVSVLMQDLRSENESTRQTAALALGQVNRDSLTKALPLLNDALRDKDSYVRRIAAWILGHVNQERAVEAVLALEIALTDPDFRVRSVAAGALGNIGRGAISEAVRALKRAIYDQNLFVRSEAAASLGEIGPPAADAIGDLAVIANQPDRLVRLIAITALGKIGRGPAAADTLVILKRALKANDALVRFSAAEAIGQLGSQAEQALPDLIERLQDSDAMVLRATITALARIANAGVTGAKPALEDALQSPRTDIRLMAADSFWRFGVPTKDALPLIQKLLKDSTADIRRAAAKTLGGVRPVPSDLVTALIETSRDQNPYVREEVAAALGRFGADARNAILPLRQLLQDPDAKVRRAAAIALGNIPPGIPDTVLALKARLMDENEPVRQAAAWSLFKLNSPPPDALPALEKMLQDSDPESRRGAVLLLRRMGAAARSVVIPLTKLLNDPYEQVRSDTVVTLGDIGVGDAEAVPALIAKLLDRREKENIRQQSADSLGRIGPAAKEAIRSLVETMMDEKHNISSSSAVALARILSPREIVPEFIQNLKSTELILQRAALAGLASMGEKAKDAVPILIETLSHPNEEISNYAAGVLGQIGIAAKHGLPTLTERLHDSRRRGSAAHAISRIATALQDAGSTDAIDQLEIAYNRLAQIKEVGTEEKDNLRRAIDDLKRQRLIDFGQMLFSWAAAHPTPATGMAIYILLLPSCFLFYLLSPLTLLKIDNFLRRHENVLKSETWGPYVFFIGFFSHSNRVLDSWVSKHISAARSECAKKPTVRDRGIHVSLPVLLDGKILPAFGADQLRATFERGQAFVLIHGEGGAGKTSLACQIAKWAMDDDKTSRLCRFLMLPILIENEIEMNNDDGKSPLIEAIRGHLRLLLQFEESVSEGLLLSLLKRKRVLVIVDRLSEMNEETRRQIRPSNPEFPVNALIVTSRIEERVDGVSKTVLKPSRVQGHQLLSFMEAYVTSTGQRQLFDDEEFFEVCRTLSRMVGKRDITILLAKLYADQRIAIKQGTTDDQLPNSIPELMLYYLNNINRSASETDPDDRQVQHVTKIIAWECVKETFRPTTALRDNVVQAIAEGGNSERLLAYLEDRLRLIYTVRPQKDLIRFALDPLAEYFAAMRLVDTCGNNQGCWESFLLSIDSAGQPLDQIRGFIFAVRDCCRAYCREEGIKNFVLVQTETRLPPDAQHH